MMEDISLKYVVHAHIVSLEHSTRRCVTWWTKEVGTPKGQEKIASPRTSTPIEARLNQVL